MRTPVAEWRRSLNAGLAGEGARATAIIAFASTLGNISVTFWIPFLPLYALTLGASDDAEAVLWVGIATMGLGIARLLTAPLWGILSDHVGRKVTFVRTLAFVCLTMLTAAAATEPWHIIIPLTLQGAFSGFIPAGTALVTVVVPEHRLNSSLGYVAAGQYLGTTIGPAVGALMAIAFDLRTAILMGAALPAVAATIVLLFVPRDIARPPRKQAAGAEPAPPAPMPMAPIRALFTHQFVLVVTIFCLMFAASQGIRIMAPISLREVSGRDDVAGLAGLMFSLAGLASIIGALVVGRRFLRPGTFRRGLPLIALIAAGAHFGLALLPGVPSYIWWFCVVSLVQGALIPATNTLIASNVPRDRRGTAFGIASSGQALALIVGPLSAALFAAIGMDFGYAALAVLFVMIAMAMLAVREPGARTPAP